MTNDNPNVWAKPTPANQPSWAPQPQAWAHPQNMATPIPAPTPVNPLDALSRDEVLVKWQDTKDLLAQAKEAEMEMRKYVVSRAFPQATEGVNTVELGNGYELKAGVKFNYTLDTDNSKVEEALDKIATIGNQGSFIADRLVSWSASFKLTEYRTLCLPEASEEEKQIKAVIDSVLTITDAAPTLEIKEPKKAKK